MSRHINRARTCSNCLEGTHFNCVPLHGQDTYTGCVCSCGNWFIQKLKPWVFSLSKKKMELLLKFEPMMGCGCCADTEQDRLEAFKELVK